MTYVLRLSRRAERYYQRLDPHHKARITAALREISIDPFAPPSKLLTAAAGKRSRRVGPWRIIYTIDTDHVIVTLVGPRGDVYRDL